MLLHSLDAKTALNRPNFFIVGAPKAGTTALYEYLSAHPRICMAAYKEPHFFASDLKGYARAESMEEYLGFFRHCSKDALAVGEGSVWYLRSKDALPAIRSFAPEARIIAMLRNPIDLVRSFHGQALYSYIEEEADLEVAWRLQTARSQGKHIPPGAQAIETLMYGHMARLGEQVQRAMEIFPAQQIKLVFFEDFVSDTLREYESVLEFLGLESAGMTHFPPVNEAKGHRFSLLGKMLMQAPKPVVSAVRGLRRSTGLDVMRFVRRVRDWNSIAKPKAQVSDTLRAELVDYFRDDVALLGRITGRNLDHWLEL